MDYLGYLFDSGLEYRTIGCHRSAISVYQENVDNKPVSQHPSVCAILKGVFNQRPPQPRYVFILDIHTVLDFIKCQSSGRENLSDKVLTYKVVIFMVLSSASRVSPIHHLDIGYTNVRYLYIYILV